MRVSKNVPFVPEEMWIKCPKCNTMLLTTDMEENLHVCTKCNHHFRMNGRDRVEMLADKDTFVEFDADLSSHNILDFPGYDEKLEKARKTGAKESVICGECKMNGIDTVLCVMDPTFMMGSMGVITGEKITRAFEYATENAMPIVVCTAAGGARMQEGILSLMQMAKTSGAVKDTVTQAISTSPCLQTRQQAVLRRRLQWRATLFLPSPIALLPLQVRE